MERKYIKRLIGQKCKIVIEEPGERKASVITGLVEDIDTDNGFVMIESEQGLGCVKIESIVAIKPRPVAKHQRNFIRHENHAMVGIGTLIVFVAMVLVSAIAAMVLLQTAESVKYKANEVTRETLEEVSNGINIVGLTGYADQNQTKIEYLGICVKLRAGSDNLDFNKTLIYLVQNNLTVLTLNWENKTDDGELYHNHSNGSIANQVSPDGVFHTLNYDCLNSMNYGLIGLRDKDDSIANSFGLGKADLAMIIIDLTDALPQTNGLLVGEEFSGKIVPEFGAEQIFIVNAPNAFHNRVIEL
jgi:archaellin